MVVFFLRKKFFLLAALIITVLLFIAPSSKITATVNYYFYASEIIQCYHIKSASLPDISNSKPRKGKSIFFHETSCISNANGKITITARQACAVESAAKLNPHFDVYLLYASPGVYKFEGTESDRILQALLSYDNVKIHHLDYEKYTENTPVESLYKDGYIESSSYALSHASDVLRYLTLWKYGGIYLDLDVIVTRSLEDLPLNFAGLESGRNVAAGVLSFSPYGTGHNLARTCLNDLKENFNGQDWGANGPGVITRLLKNICNVDNAKDMLTKDCQGFKVHPTESFYAIPWWNWTMYFDENSIKDVLSMSKNSYVIHVWNKFSVTNKIPRNSNIPYVLYAQKFCPKVYRECDQYF